MTALTKLNRFRTPLFMAPWDDLESFWRRLTPWTAEENGGTWNPLADLVEEPDAYVVKLEIPGMKAEDVHVDVNGDVLTIKGERKLEEKKETDSYRMVERRHGSFERTFTFPNAVNPDAVQAELKDGLLTVRVTKSKELKTKRIAVKGR